MKLALHWFRRDLRVHDNTALHRAVMRAEVVLPVFIVEDALRTGPDVGAARLAFLFAALSELQGSLKELGYPLIIRCGRSEEELPKLCREAGAQAVFCNRRYEPYSIARDGRVAAALSQSGVAFESFKDAVIWEEDEIRNKSRLPYTVFTPYAKTWREPKRPPPSPPLPPAKAAFPRLKSAALPEGPKAFGHPLRQQIGTAGERAARNRWKQFVGGGLAQYAAVRNLPSQEGTSRLSADLRCGTIGIRTVMADLAGARAKLNEAAQRSCDVFLTELIWREFYLQILANFPHVMKGSFRPQYDQLEWSTHQDHFRAWCEGMTGYPIVDAAMRCLNKTGFMHNRLRMIVAMFLTKDLLLNWQWGERYFMQQLTDGDLAANNGGWQWCAGTGTDAAPYFRIFNPVTQGQKFDPESVFVRQWIPELRDWPEKLVQQPWLDRSRLKRSNYPAPVVLHEEQRPKCLAMYQKITLKSSAPRRKR